MARECMVFHFHQAVPMGDVESTLHLARLAVASLHGDDRVRLQAETEVDRTRRICRIETTREVGQALALIFGGYVRREFGDDAVQIERRAFMREAQPREVVT